jgi:signal peptidase I
MFASVTKGAEDHEDRSVCVLSRVSRALGLSTKPSPTPHPPRSTAQRLLKDWLFPLLLMGIVVSPIRSVVADWNDVPSGSMRPTILEGDRITVNKLAFGLRVPFSNHWIFNWGEPSRGDIVTFASPLDGTRLVKRVIALPGDRVAMVNNRLIVNGEPLSYEIVEPIAEGLTPSGQTCDVVLVNELLWGESRGDGTEHGHLLTITPGVRSLCNFPEQTVPAGKYFMMGDNRDFSNDSRMYGYVPRENLYGRVGYVAMSVNPRESYTPRWERWFMGLR